MTRIFFLMDYSDQKSFDGQNTISTAILLTGNFLWAYVGHKALVDGGSNIFPSKKEIERGREREKQFILYRDANLL